MLKCIVSIQFYCKNVTLANALRYIRALHSLWLGRPLEGGEIVGRAVTAGATGADNSKKNIFGSTAPAFN